MGRHELKTWKGHDFRENLYVFSLKISMKMLQVVSMLSSNRKYRTTILSHNITLTSHNENKDEHTHRCI